MPVLILCYCGYVGLYLLAVAARLRRYRYERAVPDGG